MSQCKSCDAEIIWVTTENGKDMPIDAQPSPDGRFRKERVEGNKKIVHYVRDNELEENTARLYTTHFETCPNASEHRR